MTDADFLRELADDMDANQYLRHKGTDATRLREIAAALSLPAPQGAYKCGCDVLPWCSIHGEPFSAAPAEGQTEQFTDDWRLAAVRAATAEGQTPPAAPSQGEQDIPNMHPRRSKVYPTEECNLCGVKAGDDHASADHDYISAPSPTECERIADLERAAARQDSTFVAKEYRHRSKDKP